MPCVRRNFDGKIRLMRKYAYVVALAGLLLAASCKRHACDTMNCNSGYCSNGQCSCPPGYSGVNCQTDTAAYVTFWTSSQLIRQLPSCKPYCKTVIPVIRTV